MCTEDGIDLYWTAHTSKGGAQGYGAKLARLTRDPVVVITIVNISATLADALTSSIAGSVPFSHPQHPRCLLRAAQEEPSQQRAPAKPAERTSQPGLEQERKADRSSPETIPAAREHLLGHDCDQNMEQSESAQR